MCIIYKQGWYHQASVPFLGIPRFFIIERKVYDMSKKDFVEKVTNMEDDFGQWYTDVVKQAELVDYGAVRGKMIIEPYGFAIWVNIKSAFVNMINDTGQSKVVFQFFILES